MRIRRFLPNLFLAGLFALLAAGFANASTVRGRLIHQNGSAAPGYVVTVSNRQIGRSSPSHTDGSGMYHLINIRSGLNYLEIWIPGARSPRVYEIHVVEPHTDIPQVVVP